MWLRNNEVNILKYLPEFLQSDMNFKYVANTCSAEHEKIREALQDVFNQFFIKTATWGLARYERILGITQKPTDDYQARRNRILLRYQSTQTSTIDFLQLLLKRYVDVDTAVKVTEDNSRYRFTVQVAGNNIVNFDGMFEALNLYKPAHLAMQIELDRADQTNLYIGGAAFLGGTQSIGLHRTNQINTGFYIGAAQRMGGDQTIGLSSTRQLTCSLMAITAMGYGGQITVLPRGGI